MSNIFKIILIIILLQGCTKTQKKIASLVDIQPANESMNQKKIQESEDVLNKEKISVTELPRLPAIIKAENKSAIGFQTSGEIIKINIQTGDSVKKDQILALLDSTAENFDVQNSKIDLENKKIIFNQSEKKYHRSFTLFKSGSLSKVTLEDEKNNFKIAKLNYDAALINLKAKELLLRKMELTAPFDGMITKSYKSLGDFVTPGTTVFDLVQVNDLSVFAQIPVAFFGKIQSGVILSLLNPLNGQSAHMTVQKIIPVIDLQTHTFDIYGKINDLSHNFLPGMYVEIILK